MRFPKAGIIMMAFLVLLSNAGLAFNVHFCEGVIASVTSAYNNGESCGSLVKGTEKDCCGAISGTKHEDCCKNKLVNLKEKPDNVIVKTFSPQFIAPAVYEHPAVAFETEQQLQLPLVTEYYCDAHSPPLFKLYSQYLLYA